MMTYYQTVQYIKKELANHYPQGEISSFISLIFEHFENLSPVELHARYKEEIKHDILSKVNEAIRELKLHPGRIPGCDGGTHTSGVGRLQRDTLVAALSEDCRAPRGSGAEPCVQPQRKARADLGALGGRTAAASDR